MSIYSTKAFKSYLLPAINNSDYSIIINKDIFCLDKDIELNMEIIDGKWHFLPSDIYQTIDIVSREDISGKDLSGSALISIVLSNGENLSVMYDETDISFSVFKKFELKNVSSISIGKNEGCDIVYDNRSLISREHAIIKCYGNQWIIEDHSANGVFVQARRVVGSRQLSFGDVISIFGLTVVFFDSFIAVNANAPGLTISEGKFTEFECEKLDPDTAMSRRRRAKNIFHRSPRQIYKIEDDSVEIEEPPTPKEDEKKPIGMIIGPSMTMALPMLLGCSLAIYSSSSRGGGGVFMYTGLVTAITSALIGTIWAITNLIYEKKKNRERELHRFEAYSEYLIKCANTIKEKYEKNYSNLNAMYTSADVCCRNDANSMTLWNRNIRHKDFMTHRLGLGDMPFQVKINVPKEKFTLINDSLSEKPMMIKQSYETLHNVPITVNMLEHRLIGVVSTSGKKGATDVMHNLVAQIAASNCYTDIKMAFLYDEAEDDSADWEYLKWLPHVWSEDKNTRFFANNRNQVSDVLYEISNVLRTRSENRASDFSTDKNKLTVPQYVLFVSSPSLLEGELITKYLLEENNQDVVTILLCDGFENLPNECGFVIQNDSEFRGMYETDMDIENRTAVAFDSIGNEQLESFARRLSDIEVNEMETGGDIPNSLTFFDMFGVQRLSELNVMDKWRKNRTYDSMKALIGQRAGGSPWYLDIHEKYHGPHGLIAGTTGSGKSETLQTYILSLALNFSPDDVGFFIIDYKGGGMANLFDGLPHMIGSISNLSGNQVKRAMVSIKSENKRRQRIFNENGVNNINLYTRLYKNNEATLPVPHMFIIIDEFAELKREEPDFMRELISVAQVGRSLGVHLILATQKPSGTVDDNIWSNSKFRLCLRVQDRQDSNDMLHRPDAAYITQAGRCYMQVGNDELFELFQSGYSGATYDEELGNTKLDIARMISETGKTALVGNRLMVKQKEKSKRKWIATLIKAIAESYKVPGELDSIFEYFDRNGIYYPYSEYAVLRVRDLIKAMEATGKADSLEEKAALIIRYADMNKLKLPERKEKTQLDAVVEYLADIAEKNGYVHNLQLWLPVLPTKITIPELDGYNASDYFDGKTWPAASSEWNLEVPIGKYDDPVNQSQDTLTINLSQNGHHAIIGTVVSGKSTFIQSLIYAFTTKYSPDYVNIYALDYSAKMSTAFEKMPHVGGVILENDDDKVAKFFNMLGTILEERKNMFKGGNYSQYVRANGVKVPAIIICIDNYSNFKNKTDNAYENIIMQLSKDGVSYGIFLIITAGGFNSQELSTRIGENIRTVVCLELADKFQYADALHTMRIETLPEVNIKGRGLARVGEALLEFQTALCIDETDDFKRIEMIEALADNMRSAWNGKVAKPIPVVPKNPVWSEFSALEDAVKQAEGDRLLPVAYNAENASVYGIDLSRMYCYLVGGKGRTGKTNMLRVIFNSVLMRGGQVTVIDYSNDLKFVANQAGIEIIDTDEKLYNFFMELQPDFVARNKKKKSLEQSGVVDDVLYTSMREFGERYIIISNLADFVEHVTKPQDAQSMKGFVENLLDKGAFHNVFWFAGFNYDDGTRVAGNRVYDLFIKDRKGIHFGGNVSSQRIFNFDYLPFMEQGKTLKAGIGLLPGNEEDSVHKIVVPLVK